MRIPECYLAVLTVLVVLICCSCDRQGSDNWTRNVGSNEYRYSNPKFPEYKVVVYYVREYDSSKEAKYFHDSLALMRTDWQQGYKDRVLSESRFLLLQVQDVATHKSKDDFAASFKAARIFELKDVLDNKSNLDDLIRRTAPENAPLEDDAAHYPRFGAGGLLIMRHVESRQAHGERPIIRTDAKS